MKSAMLGFAALSALALSGAAMAQTTTIITDPAPGTITTSPAPGVVIERPIPADPSATTGSVNPTPPGCASTVTRQDNPDGTSTTVRQERCNPQQ